MDRLDEIRARCEAATPGPWGLTGSKKQLVDSRPDQQYGAESIICDVWSNIAANANFIAHSREDIPYLLAEIERLKSENSKSFTLERISQQRRNTMRLIDADALMENAQVYEIECGDEIGDDVREIKAVLASRIENAPTVFQVKLGHWIDEDTAHNAICSYCEKINKVSKYCPSCGARMDGTNDN